jgi:hypothetical protein
MQMLNLFEIARGNSERVQAAFDSAVTAVTEDEAKAIREFSTWAEQEVSVAVNMRLYVVVGLLNGERMLNTHERAHEMARLCGREAEDLLREMLGPWYERRMAFDQSFTGGEAFRYGALNAGGPGLTSYGPYCAVLRKAFLGSDPHVAVLPGDSLKICIASDSSLEEAAIRESAAPYSHRHLLVASRHGSAVAGVEIRDWWRFVASPDCWFEVIFSAVITLNAVECVRLLRSEHDRMWSLAFDCIAASQNEATRALAHDFVCLRRGEVDNRIRVEVVE